MEEKEKVNKEHNEKPQENQEISQEETTKKVNEIIKKSK